MKIYQLLLKVSDYTSGLLITENYHLSVYNTQEKADNGINFYQDTVFTQIKKLNNELNNKREMIRLKAKELGEEINHNYWENEELKQEWKNSDSNLNDYIDKYIPFSKGALIALTVVDEYNEFSTDINMITMEVQ